MADRERRDRTPEGQVMEEAIAAIPATYFLLRAAGTKIGAVTPSGRGYWGLLRSLHREGPQTIPQLARSRPVSRQHIQKLASEMLAEGVIEAIENPAHKRSKLLRLTPKGEANFRALNEQIARSAEQLAEGMNLAELKVTLKVLTQLCDKLKDN